MTFWARLVRFVASRQWLPFQSWVLLFDNGALIISYEVQLSTLLLRRMGSMCGVLDRGGLLGDKDRRKLQ